MPFVLGYFVRPVFVFILRNTPAQVHLIVHAFWLLVMILVIIAWRCSIVLFLLLL
jgi:hypothetical protein